MILIKCCPQKIAMNLIAISHLFALDILHLESTIKESAGKE